VTRSILIPVDIEHPESWTRPAAIACEMFAGAKIALHALYVLPRFSSSLVGSFFPEGFER